MLRSSVARIVSLRGFILGMLVLALTVLFTTLVQERKWDPLDMDFPAVGGFTRSARHDYPNPKAGYSVSYAGKEDLRVNVYVYNSGLAHIPDGASSNVVIEEIGLIEEALKDFKARGYYLPYAERKRGESRIGESPDVPRAQRRLFEIVDVNRGRILSDVYITGYKNYFVEIRISCPEENQAASERAAAPLLTALAKSLGS